MSGFGVDRTPAKTVASLSLWKSGLWCAGWAGLLAYLAAAPWLLYGGLHEAFSRGRWAFILLAFVFGLPLLLYSMRLLVRIAGSGRALVEHDGEALIFHGFPPDVVRAEDVIGVEKTPFLHPALGRVTLHLRDGRSRTWIMVLAQERYDAIAEAIAEALSRPRRPATT